MVIYIVTIPFILSLLLLCFGNFHQMSKYEALCFIIPSTISGAFAVYMRTTWPSYNIHYNLLAWDWLELLGNSLPWEISINLVTINMLCLVNLVGTCVLSFSLKYMEEEKTLNVFMAFVYAFIGFMNILVVANSLFQFFLGWEGIGICSFLLISFWQEREEAVTASFKAMIVNKLGDVSFMIGATILFANVGFSSFDCLNGLASFSENNMIIGSACAWFLLSVFCKSAQIIFHVWLPEAMEGPTPVSALIHAATMVTAGNLLVIKTSPMWATCPALSQVLMGFGGMTCIFSSLIAINQSDIKRVVAYSTCSQLGYMVLSCGLNLYNESLDHCLSHGFFKALLFLSAGWTIHVYKHEQRDEKMGMKGAMSVEFIGFLIGSGALVALPMTAGWYTKEAVIEGCVNGSISNLMGLAAWAAAVLTSLYSVKILLSAYFYLPSKNDFLKLYSREIKIKDGFKTSLYTVIPLVLLSHYAIFYGYNYLEGKMGNPAVNFMLNLSVQQVIGNIACLGFLVFLFRKTIQTLARGVKSCISSYKKFESSVSVQVDSAIPVSSRRALILGILWLTSLILSGIYIGTDSPDFRMNLVCSVHLIVFLIIIGIEPRIRAYITVEFLPKINSDLGGNVIISIVNSGLKICYALAVFFYLCVMYILFTIFLIVIDPVNIVGSLFTRFSLILCMHSFVFLVLLRIAVDLRRNKYYMFRVVLNTILYKIKIWGKLAGLFGPIYSGVIELNQEIFKELNRKMELISYGPIIQSIGGVKLRTQKIWKFLINNIPFWPSMAAYHTVILIIVSIMITF